jgi:hypothetical protein
MVARFLYRLVSLVFFAIALVCWLVTVIAITVHLMGAGFNLGAFFAAVMMPIMAFAMHQCSIEAWRAARTYCHDPRWSHYP